MIDTNQNINSFQTKLSSFITCPGYWKSLHLAIRFGEFEFQLDSQVSVEFQTSKLWNRAGSNAFREIAERTQSGMINNQLPNPKFIISFANQPSGMINNPRNIADNLFSIMSWWITIAF